MLFSANGLFSVGWFSAFVSCVNGFGGGSSVLFFTGWFSLVETVAKGFSSAVFSGAFG